MQIIAQYLFLQIQPGMQLRSSVLSDEGDGAVLLLAAGTQVTSTLIGQLDSRGIDAIQGPSQ